MVLARNPVLVDQARRTVCRVSRRSRSNPVGSSGGAGRRSSTAASLTPCSSSEALKVRIPETPILNFLHNQFELLLIKPKIV